MSGGSRPCGAWRGVGRAKPRRRSSPVPARRPAPRTPSAAGPAARTGRTPATGLAATLEAARPGAAFAASAEAPGLGPALEARGPVAARPIAELAATGLSSTELSSTELAAARAGAGTLIPEAATLRPLSSREPALGTRRALAARPFRTLRPGGALGARRPVGPRRSVGTRSAIRARSAVGVGCPLAAGLVARVALRTCLRAGRARLVRTGVAPAPLRRLGSRLLRAGAQTLDQHAPLAALDGADALASALGSGRALDLRVGAAAGRTAGPLGLALDRKSVV